MKKVVHEHHANLNEEVWKLKFKDKPDRSSFRIDLNELKPTRIEIIKVQGENNSFVFRLIK